MRYRMEKPDGHQYTLECHPEVLLRRKHGKSAKAVKIGQKFEKRSKLDGSVIVETLVGFVTRVPLKVLATWARGFRSDAAGINPVQRLDALKADAEEGLTGVDYDSRTGEAIFSSPGAYKKYCEAKCLFDRNGGHGNARRLDDRERDNMGLPPCPVPEVPQFA